VTVVIRALEPNDQDWAVQFVADRWGANIVIAHGAIYHPHTLPGFVAIDKDERVGLVTYRVEDDRCEIVTIDSTRPVRGIGTALIEAVKESAHRAGCKRLWLTTTNDNLNALRFYQKRGFALVAVHRHAVDEARRIKPDIPMIGNDGIPLRDEIELEMMLDSAA
jgi:ribosomal protein S18 acetylase RimI-like enzyme